MTALTDHITRCEFLRCVACHAGSPSFSCKVCRHSGGSCRCILFCYLMSCPTDIAGTVKTFSVFIQVVGIVIAGILCIKEILPLRIDTVALCLGIRVTASPDIQGVSKRKQCIFQKVPYGADTDLRGWLKAVRALYQFAVLIEHIRFSVDHLFSGYHAAPASEIVCISANRLPADCHFRVRSKVIEVIIIGNKRILVHAAPASRIIIVIIPVYPAACHHNAVFVYIIIVSVVLKQLVISSGSIGVDPVIRSVQKQPARMACAVLIEIICFSAVLHPAGGKCSI